MTVVKVAYLRKNEILESRRYDFKQKVLVKHQARAKQQKLLSEFNYLNDIYLEVVMLIFQRFFLATKREWIMNGGPRGNLWWERNAAEPERSRLMTCWKKQPQKYMNVYKAYYENVNKFGRFCQGWYMKSRQKKSTRSSELLHWGYL